MGAAGRQPATAGTAAGGAGQRLRGQARGTAAAAALGAGSAASPVGAARVLTGIGRPPRLGLQPRRLCVCAAPRAETGTGVRGCPGTSRAGAGPPLPDSFLARGSWCRARRQMLRGGGSARSRPGMARRASSPAAWRRGQTGELGRQSAHCAQFVLVKKYTQPARPGV